MFFFLKKRTKKLLSICARCRRGARHVAKVFCFFFSKKEDLPCYVCSPISVPILAASAEMAKGFVSTAMPAPSVPLRIAASSV